MEIFKKLYLFFFLVLFISGCDNSDASHHDAKENRVRRHKTSYSVKKVKVLDGSSKIVYKPNLKKANIALIDGLDSDKFIVYNGSIKLKIVPNYYNPQDSNRDNTYEVKTSIQDNNNSNAIVLLKVEVVTDNNTTIDERNNIVNIDSDNDYIPDDIEEYLGKDPHNSDENNNGVLDGLEGDKLFNKQWYINSLGEVTNPSEVASIEGNDLNLLDVNSKYMGYNGGDPIILQIVDSGIDVNHIDLKQNIDSAHSLNGAKIGVPTPSGLFKSHGTMIAGIAAARAFNSRGIRGVAPFAKIAGSNWLANQSLDALVAAWYSGEGANEIAVTNNSWGRYYSTDTFYEDILERGSNELRDGKGRVYVFASGNARAYNDDANLQYMINNRFALVVSALEYNNKVASYSTPGANVWISAYGGSAGYTKGPTIATTYLSGESTKTWAEDSKKDYTYAMAGTSAAAPMVTGSVALLLEACPNLGWRDVKYILAKSAKQVDIDNSSWVTNAAGMHFSRDYGFGLVDTKAAIAMCKAGYKNLTTQKEASNELVVDSDIGAKKDVDVSIQKDIKVEWVETTVDVDTKSASDLDIFLTSPSGTRVQIIKSGAKIGESLIPNSDWMKGGFRFSTGAFLDEDSIGDWRVEIVNTKTDRAILKKVAVKIYGH